jgi:hypothetical protein
LLIKDLNLKEGDGKWIELKMNKVFSLPVFISLKDKDELFLIDSLLMK